MRKILVAVAVVFIAFFSFDVRSDDSVMEGRRVEVNRATGEVRFVEEEEEWDPKLTAEERMAVGEAMAKPGKEIPINPTLRSERDGFLHRIVFKKHDRVVVSVDGKTQIVEKSGETDSKRVFAWFILLGLLGVAFMVMSNVLSWRNKDSTFAFAFAAVAFAAVAFAFAVAVAVAFAFAFAAAAAAFAAAAAAEYQTNKKVYWVAVVIYYVAMAVVLFA